MGPDVSKPTVSFEFFPPRSEKARTKLDGAMRDLVAFAPRFVTVTYGAGGTTSAGTLDTVIHLSKTYALATASHLTFVATPIWDVTTYARALQDNGISRVVALRGDPPKGRTRDLYGGAGFFRSTPAFITAIRQIGDFEISVAAYPEKHPDAPSLDADIDMLALKCESGASRAITQFFFDNEVYYRFRDKVARRGIMVPIVPGILPILNFEKMLGFAKMCGARVPTSLHARFDGLASAADRRRAGEEVLCGQLDDLAANGVTEFHIFTLNEAGLTARACRHLGLSDGGDRKPELGRGPVAA